MRLRLLCIGRIKTPATRILVDDFLQRLRSYYAVEECELRAAPGDHKERAITLDSDTVLTRLERSSAIWLLDREGRQLSSEELAAAIGAQEDSGCGSIDLLIGGAYGFDERVRARATVAWSLSRLTFLHEWARAIIVEQLYRAAKIRRNEPYHH